jgi:hypothetical protein
MSSRSRSAPILSSRCTCHFEIHPSQDATLGRCSRARTASARGSIAILRAVSLTKARKGDAGERLLHSLRCSCELAFAESRSEPSKIDVTSQGSISSRGNTSSPEHTRGTLDPLSFEAQSSRSCCHKKIFGFYCLPIACQKAVNGSPSEGEAATRMADKASFTIFMCQLG